MSAASQAHAKHKNLKLAASELGVPWQTLYVWLKKEGIKVTGDKLRYGSDRDRLAAFAEDLFKRLVPWAVSRNDLKYQAKWDFDVGSLKVDVKSSMPRQLNKKYQAKSWSFSIKKQALVCDFICCFCLSEDKSLRHVLVVPKEFFDGLQTISVSCDGASKWLDYSIQEDQVSSFFSSLQEST